MSTIGRAGIIGGTSGLGLGVARVFHANGFETVLGGRDSSKFKTAVEAVGDRCHAIVVDVNDDQSIERFFDEAGRLDQIVVTASSAMPDRPLNEAAMDDLKGFMETKFWGAVRCARAAGKRYSGAALTLVAGAVSSKGRSGTHVKAAVNAALEGLTRSLAVEYAGVLRVNCISPAVFDSKGKMPDARRVELSDSYPAKYVGTSADVSAILFAVATNRFMTGSTVYVDGGWTAG